jgi:hypothetical protein
MSVSMSTEKEFCRLVGVQLAELSVKLAGPLAPDTPTKIELNFGIGRGKRKNPDGDVVIVTLELRAGAGKVGEHDETPILTAFCRLTGTWAAADESAETSNSALELSARERAIPVLYPLARQNLSDALGKVGANIAKWPWSVDALETSVTAAPSQPSASKPAKERKVSVETKRKHRKARS